MIDQDWRRRLSALADRIEKNPAPASECRFALGKFKEIRNPRPAPEDLTIGSPSGLFQPSATASETAEQIVGQATEKAFDLATWAAILLRK